MLKKITDYFKMKTEYRASMMELSASVSEKLRQLLEAESARANAETEALEAVKQMNAAFSPEEISGYMEQFSQWMTELKQPAFQESFYQKVLDFAQQESQDTSQVHDTLLTTARRLSNEQ